MKLFKIFERFNSDKKLPSKDFLYKEFYRRSEKPQWFHAKKFYNEDHERLNKIEIDNIRNLIDNYPDSLTHDIEKTSDFTLDCIIPETLYKVRAKNKRWGDIGIVHVQKGKLEFYYSNTQFKSVATWNGDEEFKNRTKIKEEILRLTTEQLIF